MKKNVIAILLAIALASGSVGIAPVLAAETTTQEAAAIEKETIEEETEISEEADTAESVGVIEENPAQDSMESAEEAETTEEKEVKEHVPVTVNVYCTDCKLNVNKRDGCGMRSDLLLP